MSGIVGIINLNGAPVSPQLLREMAEFMALRGPDAQEVRIEGEIGFGHAMLHTTNESLREQQPFSFDNRIWIVADARVDGRRDLIRQLEAEGRCDLKNATDVELILHSYHIWDEDCVNHLIGDFAFAIWDGQKQRLFCARDHFGVKPFYYAQTKNSLVISNSLNCIRLHPEVSNELGDQALGDFLIWESNGNPETTFFADILRLPAAHTLSWSDGNLRTRCYWIMPIQDEIRYRSESDYAEHFVELLDAAVNDRLRTDRVGIFMSGGMDSTTIAATANKILSKKSALFDLRAFTVVCDRLIPDQERYYSGLAAESLGIPIHYLVADDYRLYERYDQPEMRKPEPVHSPWAAITLDQYRRVTTHTRVTLTGEGGDAVLRGSFSHLINLFRSLQFGRTVMEVGKHLMAHHRLPEIGFRTRVRRWLKKPRWTPLYPSWLNRDFEARLNLTERFERLNAEQPFVHPRRPEAYQILTSHYWSDLFESYDPGVTNFPIETRHPLFDVRLVNYLLSLPTLPVCVDKKLMRDATQGLLSDEVRNRRKTPLAGDPTPGMLRNAAPQLLHNFVPASDLYEYVDVAKYAGKDQITRLNSLGDSDLASLEMRPLSLNYWLKSLGSPSH